MSVIVLFTGHTLSTTTFDILDWTAATLLAVRALRPGNDRLWLLVGVVLGVGLLNKPLPAFLGVALLTGIVISGPRWLLRSGWVWGAVVIAAVLGSPFVMLPDRDAGPVIAMNPDVGETIGWPDLVHTVARAARRLPRGDHPVILTENYGEAGAIDRFGPALRLPHAYSGHNAYGYWGPPPAGSAPVIAIGFDPYTIGAQLAVCRVAAHVRNSAAIGNDENGKPVFACTGPRRSWPAQWPHLRHLG